MKNMAIIIGLLLTYLWVKLLNTMKKFTEIREARRSAQDRLSARAAKHGLGSQKKLDRIKKSADFFSKPPPSFSKAELKKMGYAVESTDAQFDAWYNKSRELDKMQRVSADKLKKFPRGSTGLTPDSVKKDPKFKKAKAESEKIFSAVRQHNSRASKDWLRMARDRRRQDKLK